MTGVRFSTVPVPGARPSCQPCGAATLDLAAPHMASLPDWEFEPDGNNLRDHGWVAFKLFLAFCSQETEAQASKSATQYGTHQSNSHRKIYRSWACAGSCIATSVGSDASQVPLCLTRQGPFLALGIRSAVSPLFAGFIHFKACIVQQWRRCCRGRRKQPEMQE